MFKAKYIQTYMPSNEKTYLVTKVLADCDLETPYDIGDPSYVGSDNGLLFIQSPVITWNKDYFR